ncbi:MAG: hypothetical protein ACR2JI_03075 [Mycobacterium sp.]
MQGDVTCTRDAGIPVIGLRTPVKLCWILSRHRYPTPGVGWKLTVPRGSAGAAGAADDGTGSAGASELSVVDVCESVAVVSEVDGDVADDEPTALEELEVALVIFGTVEKSPEPFSIIRMTVEITRATVAIAIRVQRTLVFRDRPGSCFTCPHRDSNPDWADHGPPNATTSVRWRSASDCEKGN